MNLFAYGSLMFPEVWNRVTGLTTPGTPVRLTDHAARRLRDVNYPALIYAAGEETNGVLYADITPPVLAALDAFEGAFYERVMLGVLEEQGSATSAWVYRAASPRHPDILPERWEAPRFEREHLREFLRDDPGFSPSSSGQSR